VDTPYKSTAPWNIVYVPKIIDPFTGHEAKGEFVDEFTKLFQQQCYEKFKYLIDDFNSLMTCKNFIEKINTSKKFMATSELMDDKTLAKFEKAVVSEFSPILIEA
jgi:hypothetical protein